MSLQDDLLNRLEAKEYASLQWGFVNGAFTEEELDAEAEAALAEAEGPGTTTGELWEELVDRRLLIRFPGNVYRTRFAETVRLLFHLRQLFPGRHWLDSPTLVTDYRLIRKPRLYPRRHIDAKQVLAYLEEERRLSLSNETRRAIRALVGDKELARFQLEATARILGARHQAAHQGTIVSAGTGTGKTLAFYLPCFAEIAGLVREGAFSTLCLALYPRNELLKDQFQTAYANARLLDRVAARPVRIGAFYGATPGKESVGRMQAGNSDRSKGDWERRPQGYVCPYLRCPTPGCNGELLWRNEDLRADPLMEQLFCPACRKVTVPPQTIALTREAIETYPPDVLFTTTEMLNRSLSNRKRLIMLGIGAQDRLRFVLLDEAHTYAGVSGAQNALLLRRWKRLLGYAVHFVGLSATLTNPRKFLADLIGEGESAVEAVGVGADLVARGWEYQIALRGDPASQVSLLSTSIQTVMLLGRMLDPLGGSVSDGVFASKVFAFTDDLDVTNRFYHNLRHAENFPQPPDQRIKLPLAFERRPGDGSLFPDIRSRERMGQRWDACEQLNRDLRTPLITDRVSSQDSGVDPRAEVVIATASLEVGFDDANVGAVVQHKAPRGPASFLQRKGRAGRNPRTRPWTIVVLSDFGRDRVAYQGYEQLFDPELDRTDLPVRNRYVLKMQAVFTLMDYIGQRMRRQFFDVWNALASPSSFDWAHSRRENIAEIVRGILEQEGLRERFRRYLQEALDIPEEEALALFWQPPRALMTEVLPTILRRMETNFANEVPAGGEEEQRRNPLPEFVTSNLFSNLLVPEVQVVAGALNRVERPDHEEFMGILQALNHCSPGRVTRRFAVNRNEPRDHWCPPPSLTEVAPQVQPLPVSDYVRASYIEGVARFQGEGGVQSVNVHRPLVIQMQRTEQATNTRVEKVDNTSRTALVWKSQFHPSEGQPAAVAASIPLHRWIPELRFFTHNTGTPLRVQRFAIGSEGSIYIKPVRGGVSGPREERRIRIRFTEPEDPSRPAAVGFEQDVDAIGFVCDLPDDLLEAVRRESAVDLRAPYFQHRVHSDPALAEYSVFDREWFAQVVLSVYVAVARTQGMHLGEAVEHCRTEPPQAWRKKVEKALEVIFQLSRSAPATDEDELDVSAEEADGSEEDSAAEPLRPVRRRDQLLHDLTTPCVRECLADNARALYESPDDSWNPWLRERLRATLGYALLQACYEVAAEYQTAELYLDLDPGPPSASDAPDSEQYNAMLWISESIAGGAGVVEEVRRQFQEDPERFFGMVESALRASRWEQLNQELRKILELQQSSAAVREAFMGVRTAVGIGGLNQAREQLLDILRQNEVGLSHTVTNALNIRVLHPASSPETDTLLHDLMVEWDAVEAHLGVNIEARVFAYIASHSDALRARVQAFLRNVGGEQEEVKDRQIFAAVYGMLWPRGYIVRERAFDHYNPFAALPTGDSLLLERRIDTWPAPTEVRGIAADTVETIEQVAHVLQTRGSVRLVVPEVERERLKSLLLELIATPIEAGFLLGYPRVAQARHIGEEILLSLILPEALS